MCLGRRRAGMAGIGGIPAMRIPENHATGTSPISDMP